MINRDGRNPLRYIFVFSVIIIAISTILLAYIFLKEDDFVKVISIHKGAVFGILLLFTFAVCYIQKNIFAWWIAFFYLPIMFVFEILEERTFNRESIVILVVFSFIIYYIKSKYEAYKEYICSNDSSGILGLKTEKT